METNSNTQINTQSTIRK